MRHTSRSQTRNGEVARYHQPCPDCGSSDARTIFKDGGSFCHSCKSTSKVGEDLSRPTPKLSKGTWLKTEEIENFAVRGSKERGVTKAVCEFFGIKTGFNDEGEVQYKCYPYVKTDGQTTYKVRRLPKDFQWSNGAGHLFGKSLFSPTGKRLVICEGEEDVLAVAQAALTKWNKIYPVIGLSSASAVENLVESLEWIRGFKEVVLLLDNDEAGKTALARALKIVGVDKAKIPTYLPDCKDASDVLVKHGAEALNQIIWDAAPYTPSGIITKEPLWNALVNFNNIPSIEYPPCLSGVNAKTKGMRLGEIALYVSGTGSGKSSLIREIIYHLLKTTEDRIGLIALEEAPAESARKLSGLALNRNPAAEEIEINDLKVGFDEVFGDDRVVVLDHQGSLTDDSIVDLLEYMCLIGCKYLFIDHLTILISEGVDGLSGLEAQDKTMNDLLRIVKRHDVHIGLVSHLRKTQTAGGKSFEDGKMPTLDDIRGSGSTKQISMDVIAFARNMNSEDELERNTIKIAVLKCRHTGLTGPAGGAIYDFKTGRLNPVDVEPFDVL